MTYDLRYEHWLPLRRRSGTVEWGTIASIVSRLHDDPVMAVASPRADFDAATTEFLIGVVTAAMAPTDLESWIDGWQAAPSEAKLQQRLDTLPGAFDLDGEGPRFMQDLSEAELAQQEQSPIQDLLLNSMNSSLFIKPGTVERMSRAAAAMALITAQSYSTAAGRGYRTGMRGGGPLTTLADPRAVTDDEVSLWQLLWANVETLDQLRGRAQRSIRKAPADIFPWLGPTRSSDASGKSTTTDDAHPLQAYFGMPRRIRLEFADESGMCDITGRTDVRMVTGFRVKGYGTQYVGWKHPLSPHYAGKAVNELLPVHPQPGGIGWRDWLPLLHAEAGSGKEPSASVSAFASDRADAIGLSSFAIRAFGYDATNAKLRSWVSASLPGFPATDPARLNTFVATVRCLVDATDVAAFLVKAAVVSALHASGDAPGDYAQVKSALWHSTEAWFFSRMEVLVRADDIRTASKMSKQAYIGVLTRESLSVFDEYAPSDATRPEVLRRVIRARFSLCNSLRGSGKMGDKISVALDRESPMVKAESKSGVRATKPKSNSTKAAQGTK